MKIELLGLAIDLLVSPLMPNAAASGQCEHCASRVRHRPGGRDHRQRYRLGRELETRRACRPHQLPDGVQHAGYRKAAGAAAHQLDGGGPEDGAAQRDAAAARRADLDEADRRAALAVAAALTHVFADWGENDIATLVRLLRRLADNALSRAVPKRPPAAF